MCMCMCVGVKLMETLGLQKTELLAAIDSHAVA